MAKNKATLKRKCDKLFSQLVRARGTCQKCGRVLTLQPAHIYSRRYLNTRWVEDNCLCLCAGCHFWAHQNPLEFVELVKKILGGKRYEELIERHYKIVKVDFQEVLVSLEEKLEKI